MTGQRWVVEPVAGVAALHERPLPDPPVPTVWIGEVDRPTIALGSTQDLGVVAAHAAEAAGVEVLRRHSGGGAVLLVPGAVVWIDVIIPATDPRWSDDVGRAFGWLGEAWRQAVAGEFPAAVAHQGPMVRTDWSALVCFAGLGPGEVTAEPGGPKLVGISQRRTRTAARFQCAVHLHWDPWALVRLLDLPATEKQRCVSELTPSVACWPGSAAALVQAFLAALDA